MVKMRFMFIFLIFALSISFFYPKRSHADITIPFSSTFNCPEQSQSTAGWVNCDGMTKAGDHTSSSGSESQITTAANYPGGGGGRGHRYWIGPGDNNNSGSIRFDFDSTPTREMWVRWYVRWEAGLDLNNSQKVLYIIGGNNLQIYFDIGDNENKIRVVSSGNIMVGQEGFGWLDLNGGSAQSDGAWHCFEIYVKNNTTAGTDILTWWIDGVQRAHTSTATFNSNDPVRGFGLPANQRAHNISRDYFNDTDDIAISTTGRIGCIGGPAAPKNLKVQ